MAFETWDWDRAVSELLSMNGDVDALQAALDGGLSADLAHSSGHSLLHYAAMADWNEASDGRMRLLLSRARNLEARARTQWGNGWTPLHVACYEGYAAQVEVLVEFGADINARTDDGKTPLMLVAEGSVARVEKVRLLLDAGADPTHPDAAATSVGIWRGIVADRKSNASVRLPRERAVQALEQAITVERILRHTGGEIRGR